MVLGNIWLFSIASIFRDRDTPYRESASKFSVMCRSLVGCIFNAGTVD